MTIVFLGSNFTFNFSWIGFSCKNGYFMELRVNVRYQLWMSIWVKSGLYSRIRAILTTLALSVPLWPIIGFKVQIQIGLWCYSLSMSKSLFGCSGFSDIYLLLKILIWNNHYTFLSCCHKESLGSVINFSFSILAGVACVSSVLSRFLTRSLAINCRWFLISTL